MSGGGYNWATLFLGGNKHGKLAIQFGGIFRLEAIHSGHESRGTLQCTSTSTSTSTGLYSMRAHNRLEACLWPVCDEQVQQHSRRECVSAGQGTEERTFLTILARLPPNDSENRKLVRIANWHKICFICRSDKYSASYGRDVSRDACTSSRKLFVTDDWPLPNLECVDTSQ
jgi:hypothetical protein